MKTLKEAALENLREAKRLLTEVGWVKGRLRQTRYDPEKDKYVEVGYCSVGAVDRANGGGTDAAHLLLEAAARRLHDQSVVSFNDACLTTKGEVLAMFDKAIEIAESDNDSLVSACPGLDYFSKLHCVSNSFVAANKAAQKER